MDSCFAPRIIQAGNQVSDWITYTPVLYGITTAPTRADTHAEKAAYRIVDKSLEVYYQYSHSDATGAADGDGIYGWGLPLGFSVDTNVVETTFPNGIINTVVGTALGHRPGVALNVGTVGIRSYGGTLAMFIRLLNLSAASSTSYNFTTAQIGYSFTARVPIL